MLFDEMAWHGICTFVPDVLRRIITRQTLLHGTVQQITCTILYPLLRLECSMHAAAIRPSYVQSYRLTLGAKREPCHVPLGGVRDVSVKLYLIVCRDMNEATILGLAGTA